MKKVINNISWLGLIIFLAILFVLSNTAKGQTIDSSAIFIPFPLEEVQTFNASGYSDGVTSGDALGNAEVKVIRQKDLYYFDVTLWDDTSIVYSQRSTILSTYEKVGVDTIWGVSGNQRWFLHVPYYLFNLETHLEDRVVNEYAIIVMNPNSDRVGNVIIMGDKEAEMFMIMENPCQWFKYSLLKSTFSILYNIEKK